MGIPGPGPRQTPGQTGHKGKIVRKVANGTKRDSPPIGDEWA